MKRRKSAQSTVGFSDIGIDSLSIISSHLEDDRKGYENFGAVNKTTRFLTPKSQKAKLFCGPEDSRYNHPDQIVKFFIRSFEGQAGDRQTYTQEESLYYTFDDDPYVYKLTMTMADYIGYSGKFLLETKTTICGEEGMGSENTLSTRFSIKNKKKWTGDSIQAFRENYLFPDLIENASKYFPNVYRFIIDVLKSKVRFYHSIDTSGSPEIRSSLIGSSHLLKKSVKLIDFSLAPYCMDQEWKYRTDWSEFDYIYSTKNNDENHIKLNLTL